MNILSDGPAPRPPATPAFLRGGGACGALIAERDWAGSPLGPLEAWPQALRAATALVLRSPVPMVMLWGPDGVMLYNDAYSAFAGGRHPRLLGSRVREGWPEVADFNDHVMTVGLAGGTLAYRDQELTLYRHGRPEQVFMNLDYSPVPGDDGEPAGVLAVVVETTEAVLARRALEESETRARSDAERVQLALDAGAIIGTWNWELPTDHFTADERFARSFGLDPDACREGLRIGQVVATVHPEDKPGLMRAIAEAIARGGPYAHQYRVRRADGNHYWIEANGRVDHGPDGTPLRFPGVLLDIEARRAVEAERDRARQLLETFVAAVPGVVYAKDRDGRMLVANRGTTELIGKPPEAYLGRTDAEFLDDPAQGRAIMETDRRIMESGRTEQVEEEVRLADGSPAFWFSTKAPLRDGSGAVVGLIGSSIDITARKAAEAALAESEDRVRRLLDQLFTFVGVLTRDGTLLDANSAPLAAAGLRPEDVVGKAFWDAHWWSYAPEVQARLRDAVARAASGETVRYDVPVRMAGESLLTIDFQIAPLREPGGRMSHLVASGVVVEDRVRAEAELRQLNEKLAQEVERAVAERADALAKLHEAQKLETIGQLTGGVAHDFNNLLTPIMGALDILRRRVTDERSLRLIGGALQSAERAATLIQRLLAFARRQTLQPRPVSPSELLDGMRDLIDRSLGPAIEVRVDVPEDLPAVLVDPNQLELALLNLAVNARDAMAQGGRLSISAELREAASVPGPGLGPGTYVRFSVADTGCGMDAATLKRAVEPFFSTKGTGKGTGLGLSMVHGLAGQSGGLFELFSRPGEGTTAVLWLPVAGQGAPAGPRPEAPALPAPRRALVLLVDDEDTVRHATGEGLRELGYEVVDVATASEALEFLRVGVVPDVVVTDHMMPGMTGAQLATDLRLRVPGLPVLMITGYAHLPPEHTQGLTVLSKPFRMGDLAAMVGRLLGQRTA